MTPAHRTVLLEAQYALDHLVWSYRSELDRTPTLNLTAEDICLSDFAYRTVALVRGVLDADNERDRPKLAFRPPSQDADRRRAELIQARRRADAAKAGSSADIPSTTAADEHPVPTAEDVDGLLVPDAVSPSRMPLRRRF